MKKNPIGVLDGGIEGICIYESLVKNFPNESFIYINDLSNYPYEGKEVENILELVKSNVEVLLKSNVSCIIVVSNSIIEYCEEYLNSLNVLVINMVTTIIDYVNNFYEHKNILFMGKEYILKANMYQKNIRYNHLYNVFTEDLEQIISNKLIKTSKSFQKVSEVLRVSSTKEVDLVVYIDSFLKNLILEFKEYIQATYLDLSEVICEALRNNLTFYEKGRGKSYCIINNPKQEFKKSIYFINCKFKLYSKEKVVKYKTKLVLKQKGEKS